MYDFHFRWKQDQGDVNFLPPANEVCESYVFTPVCQSFCSQWGLPQCIMGSPWDQTPPSPGPGTPQDQAPPWDQAPPQDQTPPQDQAPPPATRHPPREQADPPAQCMLGDTVNKWAVRILLECNLVLFLFVQVV